MQDNNCPLLPHTYGFTLAEVLIALALLGVLAAFIIPKILQANTTDRNNAIAKETMAMLSEAYILYKQDNTPTAATRMIDLFPYMNSLGRMTSGSIDNRTKGPLEVGPIFAGTDCSTPITYCLRLHNGVV